MEHVYSYNPRARMVPATLRHKPSTYKTTVAVHSLCGYKHYWRE